MLALGSSRLKEIVPGPLRRLGLRSSTVVTPEKLQMDFFADYPDEFGENQEEDSVESKMLISPSPTLHEQESVYPCLISGVCLGRVSDCVSCVCLSTDHSCLAFSCSALPFRVVSRVMLCCVVSCLTVPCLVLSCLVLSCLVLLSCLALHISCTHCRCCIFLPYRVSISFLVLRGPRLRAQSERRCQPWSIFM